MSGLSHVALPLLCSRYMAARSQLAYGVGNVVGDNHFHWRHLSGQILLCFLKDAIIIPHRRQTNGRKLINWSN